MKDLTRTICLTLAVLLGSLVTGCGSDFDKDTAANALREWRPLAEQGDAQAQFNLGLMYDNGIGVPQDDKTAVKWYILSAEQGYAGAQGNLALLYANGQGVPQDNKTAVKWFTLSAEQGIAAAQFNLGLMYHDGQGVPQDYKTALKWFTLAAEQGDKVFHRTMSMPICGGILPHHLGTRTHLTKETKLPRK
jgi:TPR repeat protein